MLSALDLAHRWQVQALCFQWAEIATAAEAVWGVLGSKEVHGLFRLHVDAYMFQTVIYIRRIRVSNCLFLEY